jgi:hypothetical protein
MTYRAFSNYVGGVASGLTHVGFAVNGTGSMLAEALDHVTPNGGILLNPYPGIPGQQRDFWMSPDISSRTKIWIAHPNGTAGGGNLQPLPAGVSPKLDTPLGGIGFWGISLSGGADYDQHYVRLCNWAYQQVVGTYGSFTTGTAARSWVRSNGYWDNYGGSGTCNDNVSFALSPPNGVT